MSARAIAPPSLPPKLQESLGVFTALSAGAIFMLLLLLLLAWYERKPCAKDDLGDSNRVNPNATGGDQRGSSEWYERAGMVVGAAG